MKVSISTSTTGHDCMGYWTGLEGRFLQWSGSWRGSGLGLGQLYPYMVICPWIIPIYGHMSMDCTHTWSYPPPTMAMVRVVARFRVRVLLRVGASDRVGGSPQLDRTT